MPKVQHIQVTQAESGQKLLQFLSRRLQGQVPRSALMRWIRTGQVRIDGARCKPFATLKPEQTVRVPPCTIEVEEPIASSRQGNPFRLSAIHEDEELLVLAKPPTLASQPGSGQEDSIADRLKRVYADRSWAPTLVHRLDKDTSGLLLVAKSYPCLRHLQGLWRRGRVRKVYLAWVEGDPAWPDWTELRDHMEQSVRRGKGRKAVSRRVEALAAAKTLRRNGGQSLVAVRLITGRRHQIRIQMASRGHPVLGDLKHGGRRCGQGLLLHACHLAWEERSFLLPPPWVDAFAVSDEELREGLTDLPPAEGQESD